MAHKLDPKELVSLEKVLLKRGHLLFFRLLIPK